MQLIDASKAVEVGWATGQPLQPLLGRGVNKADVYAVIQQLFMTLARYQSNGRQHL